MSKRFAKVVSGNFSINAASSVSTAAPNEPGLKIHSAEYGIGPGTDIDVTDAVRAWVQKGRIDVTVSNQSLGVVDRDPAKGHRKRLRVAYSVGGGSQILVEATEKDRFKLP